MCVVLIPLRESTLETLVSPPMSSLCVAARYPDYKQMVSLILRDRRWMVSRDITCWVGYTYNHLSRFKKVRRQVMQRATQKAKSNNKRRLHVAQAETIILTHSVNAGTGSRGSETSAKTKSWAIGSYGSDRPPSSKTVMMKDGIGAGERPESPVKVATSGSVEAVGTAGREGDRENTDVEEREDVPLLGVLSPRGEEDEDEVEEDGEGWAGAKNARAGKLLSHARRAMIQAEELLKTGSITFPLKRSHVQEIRQLKVMGVAWLYCYGTMVRSVTSRGHNRRECFALVWQRFLFLSLFCGRSRRLHWLEQCFGPGLSCARL